jgi:hypothetical protein
MFEKWIASLKISVDLLPGLDDLGPGTADMEAGLVDVGLGSGEIQAGTRSDPSTEVELARRC